MKFLFDLFPVLIFFGVYLGTGDLFVATGVAIIATAAQVLFAWWRWGKVEPMLWISFLLIALLGGATLLFHDKTFILWKPTALYWAFALILGGAKLFKGRDLLRALMGNQMSLPDPVWTGVTLAWITFFVLMGLLNLFVAFSFSETVWVNFKTFGTLGLTLVFVVGQGLVLSRYLQDGEAESPAAVEEK
ncbi:septation protein A [Chitiniphilus purpureus]|uniref:Inner membrane-spanning protein YciB n=1 Tax=Chitiniphilus purpureus TaxID=2981137 RepID=A0ABY6DL66_9NEIS|nr:septation protein A [Chitiniphilus sp. CD1]UXY14216.1 septation protein A [Chitiniphilus sp. CD1]